MILLEAFVLSSDVSVCRNTNTFSRYFVLSRLSSCASAMVSFGAVGAVGAVGAIGAIGGQRAHSERFSRVATSFFSPAVL
jgi:hypothetical protein